MNWYNNLDLKKKLLSGFILVALIAGAVGTVGILKIRQLDNADTELAEQDTIPLGRLSVIVNCFQRIRVNNLYALLYAGNPEKVQNSRATIAEYHNEIMQELTLYEKERQDADDRKLTAELKSGLGTYDQVTKKVLNLAEEGKQQEAMKLVETEGATIATKIGTLIKEAITMKQMEATVKSSSNTALADGAVKFMVILAAGAMLLAIGLGLFISRIIMLQLGADPKKVGEIANLVAAGDLSRDIPLKDGDSSSVMASMKTMVGSITSLVTDANLLSQAAIAGKLATRADAAKHQGDYKKIIMGVNGTLDAVIGPLNVTAEYVDRISKGDIPPRITDSYNGDFNEVKLNLNNCIDNINALVTDANLLAQAAMAGKLATRADAAKHQGDFQKIVEGVNGTLDAVIGPLNVTAEYVDRISKGDIPPRITDSYNGDFNEVKLNLNNCIDNINALVTDASLLAQAAIAGKLATRADAAKHQGDFRKIVEGVNGTLDAVIGPLNVAAEYVERISKGEIPPRITYSYNGDFNEIKNNLNVLIVAMATVTEAASQIALGNLAVEVQERSPQDQLMQALTRMVTTLRDLAATAEKIAGGDLTVTVKPASENDAMGNAFAAMVINLRETIGNVGTSSDSISTATKQIATGNSDMAQRSESQAASLEEIAASMEELTATVKQNADNSKQADQLAINASNVAVKGGTVITRVVETMESISGSSKKIADIISVIDGIAFQTNILALNAAVEAARAGEQGRGFAVVAGEVRNLAQRSAAAAKEIKELISDSVDKVGNGSKLVGEAGETMQEIVTSIKKVTDIMAEIATASNEQSVGIEQINSSITSMNDMTQENALVVQQTSSASDALEEQVRQLVEAVNRFILDKYRGGRKEPGKVLKMESAPSMSQVISKEKGVGRSDKANGYHEAKGGAEAPSTRNMGQDMEWIGF